MAYVVGVIPNGVGFHVGRPKLLHFVAVCYLPPSGTLSVFIILSYRYRIIGIVIEIRNFFLVRYKIHSQDRRWAVIPLISAEAECCHC